MAQKTWFFPPSFDLLPDGEVSLGSIIPHPNRPTLSLASLSSHPEIILPEIRTLTEADHNHSRSNGTSLAAEVFLKLVSLALEVGNVNVSRFTKTTFGSVDLETRVFSSGLSEDVLKAIMGLSQVKKHMNGGMLGKRPIYIISGLRVAKGSFQVTSESKSSTSTLTRVSTSTGTGPLSLASGSNVTNNREQGKQDSFKTAPGIVFAYRLHVIRSKRDGEVEAELFSHRTAFLTGEAGDEESEEELEYRGVTADVLQDDMEIEPNFEKHSIADGQESCISFK
ncbi:hypothetical protein TARUN_1944 [Trichoderma arundinaceum]|uniref:Uncharacterized protein n=1 Tax=Trichoderma arundinaceum TaxID=490622 RepID=A0A395NW30_TRIAR|nr:hypothetical protein TARUN_1944 [Trichoderma arundinaceum]